MSDTVANLKKRSSLIWQLFQTIIAALVLGLCAWVLSSVETLKSEMATLKGELSQKERIEQENSAQWNSISDLSEVVRKNEIEVIVLQRMFQMLLDHNGIEIDLRRSDSQEEVRINTDDEEFSTGDVEIIEEEFQDLYERIPQPTRQERIDVFREEKLRRWTREQMLQQQSSEK